MNKKPQKFLKIFFVFFLSIYTLVVFSYPVFSDEIDDLENQIEEKTNLIEEKKSILENIGARISEISNSNYSLSQKINLINAEISSLEKTIEEKETEINDKLEQISIKQNDLSSKKVLLDDISSDLYMQSRYSFSQFLLSNGNWDDFVENIFVKKNVISFLKDEIEKINIDFTNLAESKAQLAKEKEDLDKEKEDLDSSYKLLADEKAKLQRELNSQYAQKNSVQVQIGSLSKSISDLQNMILAIKGGSYAGIEKVSSSSYEPETQRDYFIKNAPSGTFGVFSFGSGTHRNGMSQWGAWERSEQGQSYQQILSAYYPGSSIKTGIAKFSGYGTEAISETINVSGFGNVSLESYYLQGIREINPAWNNTGDIEILKAQAIAARTYALNRTRNGRSAYPICTTTSCQVFSTDFYGGAWSDAVNATRGMVLVNSSGYVFSSEYAAVHGGYINNVGYDVKEGEGSWIGRAWENLSGVSWFYKNWFLYNGNSCSAHPNPWLTSSEMADLLNAYQYLKNGGSKEDPRLTSVDVSTCWGKSDNPYSHAELRSLVSNPIISVSSVSTTNSDGWTTALRFYTDRGEFLISGTDNTKIFRDAYNLRAPGFLSIPQSNPSPGFIHINIEKK